jgi:co-chaperonin GroES (HSP10)
MSIISKLTACGEYVFIKKDEARSPIEGFSMPEISKTKPNTGEIISVGLRVADKNIKKGRKAIFNANAGFIIEIFDESVTVLTQDKVLGVC